MFMRANTISINFFMSFLINQNRKRDDRFYCVISNNAKCIIDR